MCIADICCDMLDTYAIADTSMVLVVLLDRSRRSDDTLILQVYRQKDSPMEESYILDKIEQWVDKLPYRSVKIEVELPDKTVVLTKDRQRPIGFSTDCK